MTDNTTGAPAGWYKDGTSPTEQRWWNGTEWTDFYFPPRPGQALTAQQEAERAASAATLTPVATPAATPVATPVATPPAVPQAQPVVAPHAFAAAQPLGYAPGFAPAPRRKGHGGLIAIIASAVVVILIVAVVVVVNVGSGALGGAKALLSHGYEYEPTVTVNSTHTFTFPTHYNVESKLKSLGVTAPDGKPAHFEKVIDVYTNPEFTSRAAVFVDDQDQLTVAPAEDNLDEFADSNQYAAMNGDASGKVHLTTLNRSKADQNGSWGDFGTYYIVQKLDANGHTLKYPIVTTFHSSSDTLATPRVNLGPAKGSPGAMNFTWDRVPGATEYVIVTVGINPISLNSQDISVVAGVAGSATSWNSSKSILTDTGGGITEVTRQNAGLAIFTGSSADDEKTTKPYTGFDSSYAYGVVALGGKTKFSAIGTVDGRTAGALPYENATNADAVVMPQGAITTINEVPTSFPFTSLDGATHETRGVLLKNTVVPLDGGWAIGFSGAGTSLVVLIALFNSGGTDVQGFISQYNAMSLADAPQTGLASFPVIATPFTSAPKGVQVSKIAPDLGYPIFGSDAFTRYVAANLVAHEAAIDISKYTKPGNITVDEAWGEAQMQDPYIMDVTGYSLSPDGNTMYVTYGFDAADTTALQQSVKAKVVAVVASVTNATMTPTQKVVALNNWVAANTTYDEAAFAALSTSTSGGYPTGFEYAWDPNGALILGKAVCGGYASAFDLLDNAAGIPTVVVTGDVTAGGRHDWNKVELDGVWKDVDVTWDDSRPANQFLIINDDQFTGTATRAQDEDFWMPAQYVASYNTPQ